MKKYFLLLLLALMCSAATFAKSEKQVVVFSVDLHCQGCVTKVEKNIAFEKGVRDLACDLQKKTVTVTFDPAKTSVESLQKAFEKIGKPAKVVTPSKAASENADATSAATPKGVF